MPKIAILGAAPSSRLLAPFNDLNWEIWLCSPPNYDLPRQDAWFELHHLDRKFAPPANKPWVEKLKNHPRVYVAHPDARLPNAIVFPKDELIEKYGPWFFTSSIAWMLAFAIEQKPEKIGLWGVDMSASEEYSYQRPGCHFFIREARKAGIPVIASRNSDIMFPHPMYGYKEFSPMFSKYKARKKELEERLANAENMRVKHKMEMDKHEKEAFIFRGALDDMKYMVGTYCPSAWTDYFEKVNNEQDESGPSPQGA